MEKEYCTVADVENYAGVNVAVDFQDEIEGWIKSMSNYISLMTGREWLADETASDRYYDGNGLYSIGVGDFIGDVSVYLGDSYGENMVETDDFITFPYNSNVKNTIILKNNVFDRKIKNVKVNAKWGYSATVPEDIKFATAILVTGIILSQTNQDGEIQSEKIGNYTVSYVTDKQKSDFEKAKDIIQARKLIRV